MAKTRKGPKVVEREYEAIPPGQDTGKEAGTDAPSMERFLRDRLDEKQKQVYALNEEVHDNEQQRRRVENMSLEFSDNTITVRDGLDRIVHRMPLHSDGINSDARVNWPVRIGELMALRGAKNIGIRLSEQVRFNIRDAQKTTTERLRKQGQGEGMNFVDTTPNLNREI